LTIWVQEINGMADQPESGEQQTDTGPNKENGEPRPVVLKAEKDVEIDRKKNAETQRSREQVNVLPPPPSSFSQFWIWIKSKAGEASLADWAMVLFTLIIAASTITYTVYAKRQWNAMSDQLAEMKSSGTDTKNLAIAAGKQADAAGKQTDKMAESLRKTDDLISQATEQAKATNRLAMAARDQVAKLDAQVTETHALAKAAADQFTISAKALTANQRPWVSFDIRINGPLTFDADGAHLSLAVTFKNTGGSTAIGSGFEIEMYHENAPQVLNSELFERDRVCQRALSFRRRSS
jgi:hypothetical protein